MLIFLFKKKEKKRKKKKVWGRMETERKHQTEYF